MLSPLVLWHIRESAGWLGGWHSEGWDELGYDAFISYSHHGDEDVAKAVQQGLQRLAKPWNRRRALHVFRDDTSLTTSPDLWGSIERALDDSDWFVLFASPEAAASEWVGMEIARWIETKDPARILPVVTAGTWEWDDRSGTFTDSSDAVPPTLRASLDREPRHLDLRWAREARSVDLSDAAFRSAIADLAAPIHGVSKEDLDGEDLRQQRRTRNIARLGMLALSVLTVTALVAAVLAVRARDEAVRNAELATLRRADAGSVTELSKDPVASLLVAAQVQTRLDSTESRSALLDEFASVGPLERVRRLPGGRSRLADLSDDGSTAALVDDANRVRVVDTETLVASDLVSGLADPVAAVAMTGDGSTVVVGSRSGEIALLWADGSGARCPPVQLARGAVELILTNRRSTALVGQFANDAVAWRAIDLERCAPTRQWLGDPVRTGFDEVGGAFSPDGAMVALTGVPGRVFDASRGASTVSFSPTAEMRSVAWAGTDRAVAVASPERIDVVDALSGETVRDPIPLPGKARRVVVSPDGKLAAVLMGDGTTALVDLRSGRVVERGLVGPSAMPLVEAFDASGQRLVALSGTEVVTWRIGQVAPVADVLDFTQRSYDVEFQGPVLLVAAQDGSVHRLDVTSGRELGVATRHARGTPDRNLGATGVAVGPSGSVASVADTDTSLLVEPGDRSAQLDEAAYSVAWSIDGRSISLVTRRDDLVVLDASDLSERWRVRLDLRFSIRAPATAFSPDGSTVYSSADDGVVAYAAADGSESARSAIRSRANGLAVQADSGLVAAALADGTIRLMNPLTLSVEQTFASPDGTIQDVEFVPGRGLLVAAGSSGSLQVWDLEAGAISGQPLRPPQGSTGLVGAANVAVSSDGSTAAVAYHPGGVVLWELDPVDWVRRVCELAGRDLTAAEWERWFGSMKQTATC